MDSSASDVADAQKAVNEELATISKKLKVAYDAGDYESVDAGMGSNGFTYLIPAEQKNVWEWCRRVAALLIRARACENRENEKEYMITSETKLCLTALLQEESMKLYSEPLNRAAKFAVMMYQR